MNPIKVALNVYSKTAYQVKHLADPDQTLPDNINIQQLAWKRDPGDHILLLRASLLLDLQFL